MDESVLNPELFAAMCRALAPGHVRVINRGLPLEGFYQPNYRRGAAAGEVGLQIVRRGETYVANCPFCGDTRSRLAVNHMCGVHDPNVRVARPDGTGFYEWHNWELWKCYNEECQGSPDYRRQLREMLTYTRLGRCRPPAVVGTGRPVLEPVEFPGLVVGLHELPPDHPAQVYLRDRRFDPDELGTDWGVGYAVSVPARSRGAMSQGRIIVPVYRDRAMVGWQARFVGDIDWKAAGVPKYLTYFPKSLTLYGIDEADVAPVVTLVEGVSDVWRVGHGAVSGLGKTLSPDQAQLLAGRLRGRPLVVVPDMDDPDSEIAFYKSAAAVIEAGHTGPVAVAPLPPGKDPADLDGQTLRRIIRLAARQSLVGSRTAANP